MIYYTSPPYPIGRHFWRFVVKQSLYYGRVSEYQWSTTQAGEYRPDKDWPTYDSNDGIYAGCPHGLRRIFDTHRNEIDAALYDRAPAQGCLI